MYMNEALYRTNLNEAEIPDENKLTELRKVFGEIETFWTDLNIYYIKKIITFLFH